MLNKNYYNPDILNTLSNLSNDEVFTPPKVVNYMLDNLPSSIWSNSEAKFLDPVSKSGVFLREITKRLNAGLKKKIPNQQKRINHIFLKQIYGVAITELTALISRRTLYYTKNPKNKFSVCNKFNDSKGNVFFKKIEHNWNSNGLCNYCGASKIVYDRGESFESHAYEFIHNKKLFNSMKFDVIVGNPPYQLNDGGHGSSAKPIYHLFVEQAKKLEPRYLSMIIPSRWFSGGKGLDEFRKSMLEDKRTTKIVDYFDSTECFPNVDISGGVCYFLWEKNRKDDCEVISIQQGKSSSLKRPMLEKDSQTFIRFNQAVKIFRKVKKLSEDSFQNIVSERRPFALDTNLKVKTKKFNGAIKCYAYPKNGYLKLSDIEKNKSWVDKYKVFTAKAYGERGSFPYLVTSKPYLGEKNSCCTETYLVVGPFKNKSQSKNAQSYMKTKFFRFFVLLKKNTQNAARGVYSLVPNQDFSDDWSDEKLQNKYKLSSEDISFIDSMIRPME